VVALRSRRFDVLTAPDSFWFIFFPHGLIHRRAVVAAAEVYQQFPMAQELCRVEVTKPDPTALPSSPQVSTEPLDYKKISGCAERAQRI